MLDVHPPHQAAHSWRDFFIHIATIVVGLLIAIGLEQTVEAIHHHHQLREAHDALDREYHDNAEVFATDTDYLAQNIAALRNNLTVLLYIRDHPKATRKELPGVLIWPNLYASLADITWRSVQSANITELMSREEVSKLAALYEALQYMNQSGNDSFLSVSRAATYTFSDPDPTHFSQAQLEREIELTQEALLGKYRLGIVMGNIGKSFPDFKHAPSLLALQQLSVATPLTPAQQAELSDATAITTKRLADKSIVGR